MFGKLQSVIEKVFAPRVVSGSRLPKPESTTTVVGIDVAAEMSAVKIENPEEEEEVMKIEQTEKTVKKTKTVKDVCRKVSSPIATCPPPQFDDGANSSQVQAFGQSSSSSSTKVSVAKKCAPPPGTEWNSPPKKAYSPPERIRDYLSNSDGMPTKPFKPLLVLPGCHPEDIEAAMKKIPLDHVLTTNLSPLFGELGIQTQMALKAERELRAKL